MRALQVNELSGPEGLSVVEVPEPVDDGTSVLVEVRAAGVSFPDLLQTRGLYQIRPEPPFVPGLELAGVVRSAPADSPFNPGDRVCGMGRAVLAEVAVANPGQLFPLPDALSWEEGAALVMNYQTAVFCMLHRGGLQAGESVLVLGASGGVGTSGIQVAKAVGAGPIIGLVSTEEKGEVARSAGADEIVLVSDGWKDEVRAVTDGRGVDLVYDPVGGDRFSDGIRSLARGGRLVVVGFAAGTIPEIRVNRLLLRNVSVVGAAWGEAMAADPDLPGRIHTELLPMIATGAVKPPIGAVVDLEDGVEAFRLLDDREAVGKVVVTVGGGS
ncbi:MAG: NADPH:quinone oxidoreductase family protein [Actinomycetota bacterium]